MYTASFLFYDSLNDFLLSRQREIPVLYSFAHSPAVKDAIEAIGVPHPEVHFILANGFPVNFKYRLQPDDEIKVYPLDRKNMDAEAISLQDTPPYPPVFILDVHLGKLARTLRLLGIDTLYQNNWEDKTIVQVAQKENRIILTRDIGLLKHKTIRWGYWLRSQQMEQQLREVSLYFELLSAFQPFSRCLVCNGLLRRVNKESVLHSLPAKTINYFQEFYQCLSCKKVYWKGSHYNNMEKFIEEIRRAISL